MRDKLKGILIAGAAIAALAVGGAAVAGAAGGEDASEKDKPIPSASIDKASKAALAHTGGGKVTGTEVGDEESRYEVEVTRSDGTEVDVQLDRAFEVVGDETDGRGDDNEGAADK